MEGKIANSVIEELVRGKVLREADWKRAEAIAAQQIHIHLISGDRPEGFAALLYENVSVQIEIKVGRCSFKTRH